MLHAAICNEGAQIHFGRLTRTVSLCVTLPIFLGYRFTHVNSTRFGAVDARPSEVTEEVDSTLVVRVEEADGGSGFFASLGGGLDWRS